MKGYMGKQVNSGIYCIRNIVNNKVYIGSTKNINSRKSRHFKDLNKNKHHSIKLQRAFNKYGEDNFKFEIIEYVEDINNLISREQYYIDKFKSHTLGYNICPNASSALGYKHPDSFGDLFGRKVISLCDGIVFPTIKKCAKYYNIGESSIFDHCTNSIIPSHIIKVKRFMYYDEWSKLDLYKQEELTKIAVKGSINKITKVVSLIDNKIFNSYRECARYYNTSHNRVSEHCKKRVKNPKFMNYNEWQEWSKNNA